MYERKILDQVKEQILKETAGMRAANKIVPVSGQRIDIPCEGRSVNIVYYKSGKENAPLILGFHGGGFLFGGNALNDAMWKSVSEKLSADVASVEYRKSPDYDYKAALEDASDTAHYMYDHAADFGFNRENISVMGCSAGACLAATLCIYEKKYRSQTGTLQFQNQILMYPFLDSYTDPDSKGEGSIGGPIMYIFNEMHCRPEEARLPEVSPVFAKKGELEGLPEAIFCLAENDCLKKEGYRYAEMLKEAGVMCHVQEYPKAPHGFFESGFGKISDEEMNFLGKDVREMIKSGEIAAISDKALDFIKEYF